MTRPRRAAARCALLCIALALAADGAAAADVRSYVARVVTVADGDSGTMEHAGRRIGFRLHQIDAPELAQPHGPRARAALAALVAGRKLRVFESDTDAYGRAIVRFETNALDVNEEMVRRGDAWVYTRYARDPALPRLEQAARDARRGLWALPAANRMAPWEWRARHPRERRAEAAAPPAAEFRCGGKRYCRQMHSCAEARFHLRQCGVTGLDGNGDGMPCSALCRGER